MKQLVFWLAAMAATSMLVLVFAGPTESNLNNDKPATATNVPKVFDYGEYVDQFKKAYSPMETMNKAKLFFGRTLKMFRHNMLFKDKKVDYYLGQNQFTDMTAKELKELRAKSSDSDFMPVLEARQNPDLPASSSIVVSKLNNQNGEEGESHASLADIENEKSTKLVPKTKSIVDFMEDDDKGIEDIKSVLNRLEKKPELAKQVAEVISTQKEQEESKLKTQKELEEAARKNDISTKPIPKSNNKHYDYESIVSYGSSADVYDDFAKNYAKYLMNDPNDFGFNITPYDRPQNAKKIDDDDDDQEVVDEVNELSSPMAALFGSMKSIYDYFTLDGYDENQDHDVAPAHVEKPKVPNNPKVTSAEISYDIDWRKTGCISVPRNQKDCNACYAFTTISLMEYFHCMQTKQLTEFSPQYIVDCGPKNALHGCQGGKISAVGQFIRSYGIELAATYPYKAREGSCPIVESDEKKAGYLRPQITAWQSFPSIGAWYKWIPKSPIIVGISMPTDFFGYAGGIHDGFSCDDQSIHAMLLVGSGKQDGKEFWLLKNSYSDNWGEAGYFRLSKAAPMRCFNSAVVARPKFA